MTNTKMKGKIFKSNEIISIILKQKTMFREVIKPQPNSNINPVKLDYLYRTWQWGTKESRRECPYQVGQKIFCKESFAYIQDPEECRKEGEPCEIHYKADYDAEGLDKYDIKAVGVEFLPASRMPQWASRLTLEITDIRVERLAEISRGDCMAEGCPFPNIAKETNPKEWFAKLWNATHKKLEEKFEASPWVFVYSFNLIKN